ncbi:MAG: hypothetical protein LH616_00080 [Ilumatobacteraceae bacterium]|nr:hypothetical protein [Ilumatobacteraceae bacterium]
MRKRITDAALVSVVVLSFTLVVSGQAGARPAVGKCTTPTATATVTPSPPPVTFPIPTATPSNTPQATPTATPSNTPQATPTATPANTPQATPTEFGGPSRRVMTGVDPCVTPTVPPTTTTNAGSGAGGTTSTTLDRGSIPATGSNPSPLAPIGLVAVLLGVALLVVTGIRRTKPSQPA